MWNSDLYSRCESLLAEFERKRFDAQANKNACPSAADPRYLPECFVEAAMGYVVARLRFVLNDAKPPLPVLAPKFFRDEVF